MLLRFWFFLGLFFKVSFGNEMVIGKGLSGSPPPPAVPISVTGPLEADLQRSVELEKVIYFSLCSSLLVFHLFVSWIGNTFSNSCYVMMGMEVVAGLWPL